jgi:hypothetical protein
MPPIDPTVRCFEAETFPSHGFGLTQTKTHLPQEDDGCSIKFINTMSRPPSMGLSFPEKAIFSFLP